MHWVCLGITGLLAIQRGVADDMHVDAGWSRVSRRRRYNWGNRRRRGRGREVSEEPILSGVLQYPRKERTGTVLGDTRRIIVGQVGHTVNEPVLACDRVDGRSLSKTLQRRLNSELGGVVARLRVINHEPVRVPFSENSPHADPGRPGRICYISLECVQVVRIRGAGRGSHARVDRSPFNEELSQVVAVVLRGDAGVHLGQPCADS